MNKKTNAAGNAPRTPDGGGGGTELLTNVRRLVPLRRLAYYEHLLLAERQASRLRSLLDQTEPAANLSWLTDGLDNIQVVVEPLWRMDKISGITTWADGHWVIGVNKSHPPARRRFTLCHEFKHLLDANRDKVTYQGITADQRERVADYFAACYLMPKLLLRRAWTNGIQDPEALAGMFKVSLQAMDKRLTFLGFVDDDPNRSIATYFRLNNLNADLAA
jgi:Zn-dependent peptidase ImmA (M78 family)